MEDKIRRWKTREVRRRVHYRRRPSLGWLGCFAVGVLPSCHGLVTPLSWKRRRRTCFPPFHAQRNIAAEQWKAGDVYRDLYLLEQAIAHSNAEQDLLHQERLETMQYFADTRHSLTDTLALTGKFSAVALVLTVLRRMVPLVTPGITLADRLAGWHFWTVVVAPALVARTVLRFREKGRELPPEIQDIDPEYRRFITWVDKEELEDPSTSCRNVVLCLVEQWSSAVTSIAVFGWFVPVRHRYLLHTAGRLAVACSLHQFPKLWYDFARQGQPRPLTSPRWLLRTMIRPLMTPWFVALEASALMARLPWKYIAAPYLLGAGAYALARTWRPQPDTQLQPPSLASITSFLLGAATLVFFLNLNPAILSIRLSRQTVWMPLLKAMMAKLKLAPGLLATLSPMIHVTTFVRLLRTSFTHNTLISMDRDKLTDLYASKSNFQWRYRLNWREPRRVGDIIDRSIGQAMYWLLLSGSVGEQIRNDQRRRVDNDMKAFRTKTWERVGDSPLEDRSTWKKNAMENMAMFHKLDYERGSYRDPLGIAVYKTFGVGLGYNFDHMSKPKDAATPGIRRLQARAAKSAIRRVQQLHDPQEALKVLDAITDPIEKEKVKTEMNRKAKEESDLLAKKLCELLPTTLPTTNEMRMEQNFMRSENPNEVLVDVTLDKDTVLDTLRSFQQLPKSDPDIDANSTSTSEPRQYLV